MNQLGRALTEFSDPPVSVLFVYNCNPLATAPDQNRVRRGLLRDDLFTIVHEQVLTDTAGYADLVLPATTFLEQYDVARGYGAYHLHLVQPAIAACGEARPNQELFRELGARLGLAAADAALGEVGGLMDAATRMPDRVAAGLLHGEPVDAPAGGRPVQFVDVTPATADGRVHLYPAQLAPDGVPYAYRPDPATAEFPLCLISPASEHTISSTLAEFRPGIARVKIHPSDAAARHIEEGDSVRIFNTLGEVHCEALVTPEVPPGTLSLPKGLWARSTFNGATANALVPDTLTDIAGGACFNDARVEVEVLARH
jgi:anaerobic selenocysteine-containing dehydrogenase